MPDDKNPSAKTNQVIKLARYSELGFIIPASVFLGFGLGKLLDYWLHTHWIYIAGVIFGAVVGFTDMIRRALAASRDKS